MKVGIIILNYNTGEMTRTLAKCVSEYKKVDDVVIVDNASTDDSITRLSEAVGGKIHLIQSGRNGGYSFGNNVGARFCKELGTDICMISNSDVIIEEEDINRIINVFCESDYSMLSGVQCDIRGVPCSPLSKINGYWDDFLDCFFLWRKLSKTFIQNDECIGGGVYKTQKNWMDLFLLLD